jgi:hypothetical protein
MFAAADRRVPAMSFFQQNAFRVVALHGELRDRFASGPPVAQPA